MAYSVLIAGAIAARQIDAFVKSAKFTGALENGNVVRLTGLSTTSGEDEVYIASTPVTASLSTDIFYMVNEPVNVLVNSIYAGLIDDPRDFNIAASKIFGAYKPMVGDEVIISEDGIGSTVDAYAIPADGTNELQWSASISGVSLAYELLDTTTISVGQERVTAYKLRCIKA